MNAISPRPVTEGAIAVAPAQPGGTRRPRLNAQIRIGGGILLGMALIAILAPWLGGGDVRTLDVTNRLAPPSRMHLLGTDQLGRDIYTRLMYGARVSLIVGAATAALSAMFGMALGMLAGASRWTDAIVMRIMDGLMSIPPILLAIALVAVAGGTIANVVAAVTLVETPRIARVIRGEALSLRQRPYIEAAIACGTSPGRVVLRHMLPSLVSPLLVQAAFVWAAAMLIEAALSFIGAGLPPSTPSWGNMMAEAKALWQVKPGLIFLPAAFLSVSVLGVNILGEGLRQALDIKGRH